MSANMGLFPTEACVAKIREAFPENATVELVFMDDTYRDMPKGLKGRVVRTDDIGTIHIAWENNLLLGVVWNADVVKNIKTNVCSNIFWNDYQPMNK